VPSLYQQSIASSVAAALLFSYFLPAVLVHALHSLCNKACHAFSATAQVIESFRLLRDSGVDVVTLGQYMRPTKKHMAVSEFVTPAAFEAYQKAAEQMGFLYVASGPMVRSSYRAGEFYLKNVLQGRRQQQQQQSSSSSSSVGTGTAAAAAAGQQVATA
jgi:hypothetical protein